MKKGNKKKIEVRIRKINKIEKLSPTIKIKTKEQEETSELLISTLKVVSCV